MHADVCAAVCAFAADVNHLIMTKQMTTTTQIPTAVVFFCLPMGFFMAIIHYLYSIETMIKDIMHRKEEIEA